MALNADRQKNAWFALADAERCRLLCCRLTEQGAQHVDEYEGIESTFPEREHLRPQSGAGMTHHAEEKERRFASSIAVWLQTKAVKYKIGHLVVFASPRLLGAIRKGQLGLSNGLIETLEGNLMRLRVGQLAEHPMVRLLVQAAQEP